jgi:hypothetical protein
VQSGEEPRAISSTLLTVDPKISDLCHSLIPLANSQGLDSNGPICLPEISMNDKIITGDIDNMDTGEKAVMEHYALFPRYELTAIVLVKSIESYEPFPDGSIQIDVTCEALDSIGMVYDLKITFTLQTSEEKKAILFEFEENSVHLVCGQYGILDKESIVLYDPESRSVEPDFKEDEVRKAFRINKKHKRCH